MFDYVRIDFNRHGTRLCTKGIVMMIMGFFSCFLIESNEKLWIFLDKSIGYHELINMLLVSSWNYIFLPQEAFIADTLSYSNKINILCLPKA